MLLYQDQFSVVMKIVYTGSGTHYHIFKNILYNDNNLYHK